MTLVTAHSVVRFRRPPLPLANAGGGATFPTTWPNTENPVSQGSIWTQGLDVGLDWQNTRSTGGSPGIAFGTGDSGAAGFNDNISTVQGQFSTTLHYAQIRLHLFTGYIPPSSHEAEVLTGFTIGAHSAAGYELTCPLGTDGNPGFVDIVRWNGALGDFTAMGGSFSTVSGATFAPTAGDFIRAVFDSTSGSPVVIILQNGVEKWRVTDTSAQKITSGSPGMGFFARPGAGLDLSKWCNDYFDAGNA